MSLIFYLAVFHKDEDSYLVEFPDLKGYFTRGKDMEEAYNNAKEALGLYLDKDGVLYDRVINKPSKVMDVTKNNNDGLVLIVEYDSLNYGKKDFEYS